MNKKYTCGFAAVNNGKHCFIKGKCVSCKTTELQAAIDTIEDFAPPTPLTITNRKKGHNV